MNDERHGHEAGDFISTPETERLVRLARRGDRNALENLLGRYHGRIERVVRRRMGPRLRAHVESGDVVQDTLVHVIRDVGKFTPRGERAFFRWLCGVVENRLRHIARRVQSRPEIVDASRAYRRGDQSPESSQRGARDLERELLSRAIEKLGDAQRQVIELRHYGRLSMREIGEQLERSEDAVGMLHQRAKAQLARHMSALRGSLGEAV